MQIATLQCICGDRYNILDGVGLSAKCHVMEQAGLYMYQCEICIHRVNSVTPTCI